MRVRINQKKEDKSRITERFGNGYKYSRPYRTLIWLHAVSLGESNAAINLVTHLKDMRCDWHYLITTNTITAADHIEKSCSAMPVTHIFQPLDHPQWVSRFLDYWKPDGAIFLESDFWFNLITKTKIDIKGKICIDLGASTGGFTEILLEADASKIYAVDVGQNQINYKLSLIHI